MKKVVAVDPPVSVGLEAAIAAPLAIGYLVALQLGGHGQFTNHGPGHLVLMILPGRHRHPTPVLRRRRPPAAAGHLGSADVPQPGHADDLGVVVGHEPMPPGRWIGFALIWMALVVFTVDAVPGACRPAGRRRWLTPPAATGGS